MAEPTPPTAAWLDALRARCAAPGQSQVKVAAALRQEDGYPSAAVLNQVLGGKYAHPTDRLQAIVEGALLGYQVACPVLGDLGRADCIGHQTREFAPSNQTRIALYRSCKTCSNRLEVAQ